MAQRKPTSYRKRSNGLIEARFTVNGKRYSVYAATYDECEEKKAKRKKEIEEGSYNSNQKQEQTISAFFNEWYELRKAEVKQATIRKQDYEFKGISRVVIDNNGTHFGEIKLKDITYEMCLKVRAELLKGRKVNTTNQSMALLKQILDSAVKMERISKNPAKDIKSLKIPAKEKEAPNHRALTPAEDETFFAHAEGSHYYNMFCVARHSGARHGEIAALTFSDLDEQSSNLTIDKTLTRNEFGIYEVGDEAKTESGNRTIPLYSEVKEAVNRQRKQNYLLYGTIPTEGSRIFLSPEGKLCDVTDTNREIGRICKRAGIERFTFHAFRDTFATEWVNKGGDYKKLSEILGHKNIGVTLDRYTKPALSDIKEESVRIGKRIG